MMRTGFVMIVAATTLACAPAGAQGQGPVLRQDEVTVDALVNALTPEAKTRNIRVRPGAPSGAGNTGTAAAASAERPSASLLITFETNSAELTPRARQLLDVVAKALNSKDLSEFNFAIEGHADPRGGTELNQRLSQLRAEAVMQYLQSVHGISQQRLSAVGKGERELLNPQNPIAPENRRVTIVNVSG